MPRDRAAFLKEKIKEKEPKTWFRIDWCASAYGSTMVLAETEDEAREIAERGDCPDDYEVDNWEVNSVEDTGETEED